MCDLCDPKHETEWHIGWYPFKPFYVFRCRTDGQWMIVAKHHGDWLPGEKEQVEALSEILFPGQEIRWEQRQIKDHAHVHIQGLLG